jgi:hypothetical protein
VTNESELLERKRLLLASLEDGVFQWLGEIDVMVRRKLCRHRNCMAVNAYDGGIDAVGAGAAHGAGNKMGFSHSIFTLPRYAEAADNTYIICVRSRHAA